MAFTPKDLLLYAITDRKNNSSELLYQQVEAALKGGITCLQLREKDLDRAHFLAEAKIIADLCRTYRVPFFVNDNVEVALASGADGVHVGQDDLPIAEVRRLVGPDLLIGVTVHTPAEAEEAEAGGANCLGAGAMFATTTKTDAQPMSKDRLAAICEAVSIPVVAIGGISKQNMAELKGTGIAGFALVSAVFGATDIEAECRDLYCRATAIIEGR